MGLVRWTVVRRFGSCFSAGLSDPLADKNNLKKSWWTMNNLSEVLNNIREEYQEQMQKNSRHYLEVNIAQRAAELSFSDIEEQYRDACAIVPLKHPLCGMKVRIDGRTFVNYAQFESGIVTPQYVARQVNLPHKIYIANDSMICNFA
jgi:hypothetical protein